MQYTDADLRTILDSDFIINPLAFTTGRRTDDMVDSMCICYALDIDWYDEVWNKIAGRYTKQECQAILNHAERVSKWLENKKAHTSYQPGYDDIMSYAINY